MKGSERLLRERDESIREMLRFLDSCETLLALEDHTCYDAPRPDARCEECLGCFRSMNHLWARVLLLRYDAKDGAQQT